MSRHRQSMVKIVCYCGDQLFEEVKIVCYCGDQLFEERGRNVQWAFGDGANQYDRLEGLRTEFADWHAKFTLYKVLYIIQYIQIFVATKIEHP